MRILEGILWVAIGMVAIPVASHYYVWTRLVRDPGLPPPWRTLGSIVLVGFALGVPVSFMIVRALPQAAGRVLIWPFAVWMGLLFYLLLYAAALDLLRLPVTMAAPASAERRLFLGRLLAAATAAGAAATAAIAMRSALGRVRVVEVPVRLRRLPPALDGTTIVQISDLHIGHTLGRAFIEGVVAECNALGADVVAITGDLVEGSVARVRHLVAPLARLRARHGVFFVTGNHEYYVEADGAAGADAWIAELAALGIRTLRNQRVEVGDGATSFDLAGVDDWSARGFGGGHGADLTAALAGRDPARELVLLAHQPRHVREAQARGVGLQLSGHTHGGQLWPFHHFVALFQPVVAGLARRGDTQIYVNRGTGYFGPPMRLAAPAEITRIVLQAGPAPEGGAGATAA